MRSLLSMWVFAACLVLSACQSDSAIDSPPGAGEEMPMPDPDCVPESCEEAGAQCGNVDNGCGDLLDCGGCAEAGMACNDDKVCAPTQGCSPMTCEELGAQCGEQEDGCGGVLDCGGCTGEEKCLEGSCALVTCDGAGKNACGLCGTLPLEPDEPCACEGTAQCTVSGIQCDDGGLRVLPDTDDQSDWAQVQGIGETTVNEYDLDTYSVHVDDTFWGNIAPSFRFHHPGGSDVSICVEVQGDVHDLEATCGLSDLVGNLFDEEEFGDTLLGTDNRRHGCCFPVGAEPRDVSFGVRFHPFKLPFADYSANYTFRVRSYSSGIAPLSCMPYQIEYRF